MRAHSSTSELLGLLRGDDMGGNNSQSNRFPLPENWTIEDFICMVVPVPNDVEYISMLRGLLDTLTWSRSFKLHPTEMAARQVADTWAAAFASQEITFQECGMPPFLLRQNPSNVCQLQQSVDGGDTWTLAFDYGLCSNAITTPPPFNDNPDGNYDAAANAVNNIWRELGSMARDHCAGSVNDYIQEATAYLRQFYANWSSPGILESIYNDVCGMTEPEYEDFFAPENLCDQFTQLSECANVNGAFDLLDCLNELLTNWLDETNTDLMSTLNKAAALLGGNGVQNAAGFGGAGGGAAFDSCIECVIFNYDFTVENGGFSGYDPDGLYTPVPSWISGTGWRTNFVTSGAFHTYRGWIRKNGTFLNVVKLRATYHIDTGGGYFAFRRFDTGTVIADWDGQGEGDYEREFTIASTDITDIAAYISTGVGGSANWITSYKIWCE